MQSNLFQTKNISIYMFPIAGQPAKPIGLKFLWTLRDGRGVIKAKNNFKKFKKNSFLKKKNFHG